MVFFSDHVVIYRALDRKQKRLGIFHDLSKAFDTVSAPALLNKMERIGNREHPLKLVTDYLSNRTQKV